MTQELQHVHQEEGSKHSWLWWHTNRYSKDGKMAKCCYSCAGKIMSPPRTWCLLKRSRLQAHHITLPGPQLLLLPR